MRRLLTTASLTKASLIAALSLTSTACFMDGGADPFDDSTRRTDEVRTLGPIEAAIGGRVKGAVGPVSGISDDATEMQTYDDGYYVTIETVVEKPDQAVMTLLSVSNVGDLFAVGNSGAWSLGDEGEGGTRVTMLGCVGDEVGIYNEYDKPADEVALDIDAPESGSDGEMDVTVQARWYDRDQYGDTLETHKDAVTSFTLVR